MKSRRLIKGALMLCLVGGLLFATHHLVSRQSKINNNISLGNSAINSSLAIATNNSSLFLEKNNATNISEKISQPIEIKNTFLNGTAWPGQFRLDKNGHLILDTEFADRINYLLQLTDNHSLSEIRQTLLQKASEELPASALEEATQWIDKYLSYIDAETAAIETMRAEADQPSDEILYQALQERRQRRRQLLGEDASSGIFGEEEAYEDYQFQLLKINKNKNLDTETQAALITEAQAGLPQNLRDQAAATQSLVNYQNKLQALKKQGATAEAIESLRSQLFSAEAAERLAEADKAEADWQSQRQRYLIEKNNLTANQALTENDRSNALNDFMQTTLGLTAGEQQRMRALDHIQASSQLTTQQ